MLFSESLLIGQRERWDFLPLNMGETLKSDPGLQVHMVRSTGGTSRVWNIRVVGLCTGPFHPSSLISSVLTTVLDSKSFQRVDPGRLGVTYSATALSSAATANGQSRLGRDRTEYRTSCTKCTATEASARSLALNQYFSTRAGTWYNQVLIQLGILRSGCPKPGDAHSLTTFHPSSSPPPSPAVTTAFKAHSSYTLSVGISTPTPID